MSEYTFDVSHMDLFYNDFQALKDINMKIKKNEMKSGHEKQKLKNLKHKRKEERKRAGKENGKPKWKIKKGKGKK